MIKPSLLNQLAAQFQPVRRDASQPQPDAHLAIRLQLPALRTPLPPALNITGRVNLGSNASADPWTVNESYQFAESLQWTQRQA